MAFWKEEVCWLKVTTYYFAKNDPVKTIMRRNILTNQFYTAIAIFSAPKCGRLSPPNFCLGRWGCAPLPPWSAAYVKLAFWTGNRIGKTKNHNEYQIQKTVRLYFCRKRETKCEKKKHPQTKWPKPQNLKSQWPPHENILPDSVVSKTQNNVVDMQTKDCLKTLAFQLL